MLQMLNRVSGMKEIFENWNHFVKETLAALNEDPEQEESEMQTEESKLEN